MSTALDQAVIDWAKQRSGGPLAKVAETELAQLRAGHALLVRLGEALDFDRDAQLMKEDQGDTDWWSVARAIAMVRKARFDIDAHALSLVASPAQAVKL